MKKVTKYQSDDGKIYDSEVEALKADAIYHKERSERLARIEAAERERARQEPGYHLDRGGHM